MFDTGPNGDFNLVDSVADSIWEKKHYDEKNGIGFFSHETEMKEFADKWKAISKRVRTQLPRQNTLDVKLKIWWPSLSAEFIGEDLDSFQMSKLYHCHEFVRAIGTLAIFKALREKKQINIIELAEQLGDLDLRHGGEIFSDRRDKEFNFLKKIDDLPDKHVILESIGFITLRAQPPVRAPRAAARLAAHARCGAADGDLPCRRGRDAVVGGEALRTED